MSFNPIPSVAPGRLRLLCALSLLLCCAACGAPQPGAAPAPGAPETPATALAQLRQLAAGADCDDSAQCHTVAVGQRPCGGPEAYLPWSSRTAAASDVRTLAARDQEQRRHSAPAGTVSDCRLVTDPGAECRAASTAGLGQCRLRTPFLPSQSDPR